jgi:hypothetical protein
LSSIIIFIHLDSYLKVKYYSQHLKTALDWLSNVWFVSGCRMVQRVLEWHSKTGRICPVFKQFTFGICIVQIRLIGQIFEWYKQDRFGINFFNDRLFMKPSRLVLFCCLDTCFRFLNGWNKMADHSKTG